jgi:hypothetical protein
MDGMDLWYVCLFLCLEPSELARCISVATAIGIREKKDLVVD